MTTQSGWYIYSATLSNKKLTVGASSGTTSGTIDDGSAGTTMAPGTHFTYGGVTYTYDGTASVKSGAQTVNGFYATDSGGAYHFFTLTSPTATNANGYSGNVSGTGDTSLCFYPGTMIRTPDGEVAVQTLRIGDIVLTAEGKAMPVRWIGRQTVSTLFADPQRALPIRIAAGALGENLPVRDLLVSPDHALLVGDTLIQAGALVNGSTIRRETDVPPVFTYYHVELADHSLVLAEGVPAETFVDNVERLAFDNWDEHQVLYGADAPVGEMELPRAKSHRQVPPSVRARLAARAAALMGSAAAA